MLKKQLMRSMKHCSQCRLVNRWNLYHRAAHVPPVRGTDAKGTHTEWLLLAAAELDTRGDTVAERMCTLDAVADSRSASEPKPKHAMAAGDRTVSVSVSVSVMDAVAAASVHTAGSAEKMQTHTEQWCQQSADRRRKQYFAVVLATHSGLAEQDRHPQSAGEAGVGRTNEVPSLRGSVVAHATATAAGRRRCCVVREVVDAAADATAAGRRRRRGSVHADSNATGSRKDAERSSVTDGDRRQTTPRRLTRKKNASRLESRE